MDGSARVFLCYRLRETDCLHQQYTARISCKRSFCLKEEGLEENYIGILDFDRMTGHGKSF